MMKLLYEKQLLNQTVLITVFIKEDGLVADDIAIHMIETINNNNIDNFIDMLKENGTDIVKRSANVILEEYKNLSDLDKINVISIAKCVIRNALEVEDYEIAVAPYKQSLVEMLKPFESSYLYKTILERSESLVWLFKDKDYILNWIKEVVCIQKERGADMMLGNLNLMFMMRTTPND